MLEIAVSVVLVAWAWRALVLNWIEMPSRSGGLVEMTLPDAGSWVVLGFLVCAISGRRRSLLWCVVVSVPMTAPQLRDLGGMLVFPRFADSATEASLWGAPLIGCHGYLIARLRGSLTRYRTTAQVEWDRSRAEFVVGVGLIAVAVAWTTSVDGTDPTDHLVLAGASYAAAIAATRAGWGWERLLIVPAAVLGVEFGVGYALYHREVFTDAEAIARTGMLVTVAAAGAGLTQHWVMGCLRRASHARPLTLVIVLIGLNLADSLLTVWSLGRGVAVEANPTVEAVSLSGKTLVVTLLALVLHRLRPDALLYPIAAYGVVFIWHLVGQAI